MKAAPFDYLAARSLGEAIDALGADEDSKVLAGGQSLVPLIALRLARPSVLVDIGRLDLNALLVVQEASAVAPDESALGPDGSSLRIGALVRHTRLEHDVGVRRAAPLLADAARHVGCPAIRSRGTIGGSLAHADPAAELPAAVIALAGEVIVRGPAGERHIPAAELSDGFFTNTLAPTEVLVEVRVNAAGPRHGAAWCEWSARRDDFAEVGVGIAVELDGEGRCRWVGAGGAGLASHPVDLGPAVIAAGVLGSVDASDRLVRAVAAAVTRACVSAGEDRSTLAGLLAGRALVQAFDRIEPDL